MELQQLDEGGAELTAGYDLVYKAVFQLELAALEALGHCYWWLYSDRYYHCRRGRLLCRPCLIRERRVYTMENKEVIKLALDTMQNKVSGNFSTKDGSEAIRQAFIELNGGSDKLTVKSFRDHPQLFQLIEEVMPIMIQEGLKGDEMMFNLVEYRNIAEGDQNRFWTEDNSDLVVAKIADGSTSIRRQRLNVGQYISIDTVRILRTTRFYKIA